MLSEQLLSCSFIMRISPSTCLTHHNSQHGQKYSSTTYTPLTQPTNQSHDVTHPIRPRRRLPLPRSPLEWDDIPAYFAAFYPTPESMKQAPSFMTILVDCHADQLDTTINILPLLKLQHANPSLTCTFTRHPSAFTRPYNNPVPLFTRAQHDTHESFYLRGDAPLIEQLLRHSTPEWLEDVANGTVVSIMLSAMGKCCFTLPAELMLFVDHEDAKDDRMDYGDAGWLWRRVGLRHSLTCQLDGHGYNMGIRLRYEENE
jgi:hypothetical protein